MSGHSKWSTIKRQKGVTDQKRGALFSKLAKAIQVAVKEGGNDPESNLKLKLAVTKAKQANMPKDNIARAITRGGGKDGEGSHKESVYEAFGPKGAALIINILTDNINRSAADIKRVLNKYNGKLAEKNSAYALFTETNTLDIPLPEASVEEKEKLMLDLMDLGAEDIKDEGQNITAVFHKKNFFSALKKLNEGGIHCQSNTSLIPLQPLKLKPEDKEKISKLISALNELDDVENVYSNAC